MVISSRFNVGDVVKILPLDKYEGVVLAIYYSDIGMQYRVRYFYNGDPKDTYLFDREIE
jgi:hypothetical protein